MGSLQPTFNIRKPEWRGSTSSSDMNDNFEEVIYDLNTIFSEASNLVVELNELESRLRYECVGLNQRMMAVSGLISAYEVSTSGYKMLHEDFYLSTNVVYPSTLALEEKCVADTQFGVVTLPVVNSFSKLYTTNLSTGDVYQAADLSVVVNEGASEGGNVSITPGTPLYACDGKGSTYWERKVQFNRDYYKNEISCTMDITLPSTSNPYVNKFFIRPHPDGLVDVTEVKYDTLTTLDNRLPEFPTAVEGERDLRNKMYSFNNIQPTKIKLTFKQRNWEIENNYKTFVYGAQEIGIEKVEYKSSGKVGVRFTLPNYETKLFHHITSLRTIPDYDDDIYKVSIYASESAFNADSPAWTSSSTGLTTTDPLDVLLYNTKHIWIMIELTQETNTSHSPLFESVTITYTTA